MAAQFWQNRKALQGKFSFFMGKSAIHNSWRIRKSEGRQQFLHPFELVQHCIGRYSHMSVDADHFEKIRQGICANMVLYAEFVQHGQNQKPQPRRSLFCFPKRRFRVQIPAYLRPPKSRNAALGSMDEIPQRPQALLWPLPSICRKSA